MTKVAASRQRVELLFVFTEAMETENGEEEKKEEKKKETEEPMQTTDEAQADKEPTASVKQELNGSMEVDKGDKCKLNVGFD